MLVSFFFASESTTTARGSRKLKEGVILCNWWRDKIITNHFTNSRAKKKIFCNFKYGELAIIIPLDFYIITLLHLTIKKSSYVQILILPKNVFSQLTIHTEIVNMYKKWFGIISMRIFLTRALKRVKKLTNQLLQLQKVFFIHSRPSRCRKS